MSALDYHNARQALNKAIAELESAQYYLSQHGSDANRYSVRIEAEIKRLHNINMMLGHEIRQNSRQKI